MWREPVCDRGEEDLAQGTPRAFCNAADLTRLEENCGELAAILGLTLPLRAAPWSRSDLPTAAELARLAENVGRIYRAGYRRGDTPAPPEPPLTHWRKWNDAERILRDARGSCLENRAARLCCGEAYAGERTGLI